MSDDLASRVDAVFATTEPPVTVTIELTLNVNSPTFMDAYIAWCLQHGALPCRGVVEALEDVFAFYAVSTPGVVLTGRGSGRIG